MLGFNSKAKKQEQFAPMNYAQGGVYQQGFSQPENAYPPPASAYPDSRPAFSLNGDWQEQYYAGQYANQQYTQQGYYQQDYYQQNYYQQPTPVAQYNTTGLHQSAYQGSYQGTFDDDTQQLTGKDNGYYDALKEIRELIANSLYYSDELNDDAIVNIIDSGVEEYLSKTRCYYNAPSMKEDLFNILRGLDVIDPLVRDGSITEIMVNGYDNIFIEKKGEIIKTNVRFCSEEDLENLIQRIVSNVNRSVNQSHPIVDARLDNGARVNVVLPPVSLGGPILTIRKFPDVPLNTDDLIECQSLTHDAVAFLRKLVESKHNIFISGGTGSGKTTFLNVLSSFIPTDERIITIEDSAELQLIDRDNLVRMEKRNANSGGAGEIDVRDLIKTSLRMRPDRIIVGEVRGAEAIDMLQSMNTGHDGSLSTGHANSALDMIARLETMVLTGNEIPLGAIQSQVGSAIDYIIHLSRLRDGSRRTMEISEFLGYKDGAPVLNPIFMFKETGFEDGKVIGTLVRTGNAVKNTSKFEHAGIEL